MEIEAQEGRISAPAATCAANIFELKHFVIATGEQQVRMLKINIELSDAVGSLPPELGRQLTKHPSFMKLHEVTCKGANISKLLSQYDSLVTELTFCRMVDYYLLYLSELLALIFKTRPEALKSDDKVSVETILEYSTREELIAAITEQKVLDLSFKGVVALNEYLKRRLSFALFEREKSLQIAAELVENRNLYIHNRGIVNRRYLSRMPNSTLKLGDHLTGETVGASRAASVILILVLATDTRAADKFGIPTEVDQAELVKEHKNAFEKAHL